MPETAPQDTQHEPTTEMSDTDIALELAAFNQAIAAEGKIMNTPFMWHTIFDPKHKNIAGDELIVLAAIASLTRNPAFGCRATHKAVATRAASLGLLFSLAAEVGWNRIAQILNVTK